MINKLKKIIAFSSLLLLIISIFTAPVKALDIDEGVIAKKVFQDFFEQEKRLRNQVYTYGESTYETLTTGQDTKGVLSYLNNVLTEIEIIQNDINSYNGKFDKESIYNAYLSSAQIVLDFYKNSIYDLIVYIKSDSVDMRFGALDRYFYNRLMAINTANWLKDKLKYK